MKQYLLSVVQPDGDPPPPEVLEPVMRDVEALRQEMKAAGAWVFAGGLHPPSTATVVRVRNGEVLMTDGPFAEGREPPVPRHPRRPAPPPGPPRRGGAGVRGGDRLQRERKGT